eukprot:2968289-Amphidinium_carterae.1
MFVIVCPMLNAFDTQVSAKKLAQTTTDSRVKSYSQATFYFVRDRVKQTRKDKHQSRNRLFVRAAD